MKAIVTGADGFVGSYLVKDLLANGYDVLAIDLSPFPHRLDRANAHLKYCSMSVDDISKLSSMVKANDFQIFFHLAWRGLSGSDRADETVQLHNVAQTCLCLREAAALGCKRFVCSGSIVEFESFNAVYNSSLPCSTSYIYGAAKSMAHQICKPLADSLHIDCLWAYITNTYGPGELSQRLVVSSLRHIILGEPLSFSSGEQNYDFVYVTDVAKAFRLIAEKGVADRSYMIGSGAAKPLRLFLNEMLETVAPEYLEQANFGGVAFTGESTPLETYDISLLKNDCGFRPEVSFKEGIKKTFEWLKTQTK